MKKEFVLAALVLCAGVVVAMRAYAGYKYDAVVKAVVQ